MTPYFETPQRTERLQLIVHLLNNASEIPYLRGAKGAGKQRFAERLMKEYAEDFASIMIDGADAVGLRQRLCTGLGLQIAHVQWPDDLFEATDGRWLLIVIKHAEQLPSEVVYPLVELHQAGACVLLLGEGNVPDLPPHWRLQFVDLPPFTVQQSREFVLRQLGPGVELSEAKALQLHRASEGLPGRLLQTSAPPVQSAQINIPSSAPPSGLADPPQRISLKLPQLRLPRFSLPFGLSWPMVAGAAGLLLLLTLTLLFQQQINQVFETAPTITQSDVAPKLPAKPEGMFGKPNTMLDVEQPPALVAPPPPQLSSEPAPVSEPVPESISEPISESISEPISEPISERPARPVLPDNVIDAAIAAAAQPEVALQAPAQIPEAQLPGQEAQQMQTPAVVTPPPRVVAEAVEPPVESASIETSAIKGEPWIKAQPSASYTLQLSGARERESLQRLIADLKIPSPYAIFARDLDGRPWYSLISGVYPDRDAASKGQASLPSGIVKSGIWIRTFGSIQGQLK